MRKLLGVIPKRWLHTTGGVLTILGGFVLIGEQLLVVGTIVLLAGVTWYIDAHWRYWR